MVKVFALIPRRPDVTEEFFHEHWAGPHAELAKRITTIRRYVQSHRIAAPVAGVPGAGYEGVAEVWFDDVATAAGMGEDPDYANHAHLDEPNFIDTERLGFVISDEHVVRSGPPIARDDRGAKAILLLRRRDGVVAQEAARRLAALGDRLAEALPGARRLTVATAVPEMYAEGEPAFDAIVEMWFEDTDAFGAAWDRARDAVLEQLGDVADRDRSAGLVAEELRVIWPQDVAATA